MVSPSFQYLLPRGVDLLPSRGVSFPSVSPSLQWLAHQPVRFPGLRIKASFVAHSLSHAQTHPLLLLWLSFPVPVPVSTGIRRAGLRNRVMCAFTCSGEGRPSGFWGATTRLLDRSTNLIFFPAFVAAAGDRHCNLSALYRAGRLLQRALCRLAQSALVPLGIF